MTAGPPRFAVVSPYAAAWLERTLSHHGVTSATIRAEAQWCRTAGQPSYAAELEGTWQQMQAAARDHRARFGSRPSASGSAEAAEPQAGAASAREQITTDQAAQMLSITARRVRQMIAGNQLTGTRIGRSWTVDRQQVETTAELKESA